MFVEFGYTPTVLLAPIRSPANLNVKIVSQIFFLFGSGHFLFKIVSQIFFFFFSEHCGIFKI